MLDVIIGRHTWNCQIRTHIHTGYTHTATHTQKGKRKGKRKRQKEIGRGMGFRGGRGAWVLRRAGPHTNNARSTWMFFSFSSSAKGRKQRHSLKLGKKRRESSKHNYYIISPRVIIKAIIIGGGNGSRLCEPAGKKKKAAEEGGP